jgi:hypothetical protein
MILKTSGKGPFLPNALVSANLTVRADDWHPIEQQLEIQKAEGIVHFTMGEVASKVIALSTLPPSIFVDLELASAPSGLPPPAPPALLAPIPVAPSSSDLLAAEVEAWHALHSVGACLGRPISVARVGLSGIEVEGVVEAEEIKAQVLVALRGIPHVAARIRTVAEDSSMAVAESEAEAESYSLDSEQPAAAQPPDRKLAIEDLLKQYFATGHCAKGQGDDQSRCVQQRIAELSQEALTSSEATLAQAWALHQLARWNPLFKQSDTRTSTRRLLELMVRDHMTALKRKLDHTKALVGSSFLSSLLDDQSISEDRTEANSATPADLQADWAADSLHLCAELERTMNLILGLFVETNSPVPEGEKAMRDLHAAFADLEVKIEKLDTKVAAQLSDVPKVLTSTVKPQDSRK